VKKLIASALLAATITGGGVAVAATGPVGAQEPAAEAEAHPRKQHHRQALRRAVKTSAEVIGITARELATELRAGRSIAEVAQAEGVEVAEVTDALVAKGTARIDQAVADGKITAERAAKAKARLPEAAERIVNARKGDRAGG
jgi:predicted nuclease with RNAse H fold